MVLTGVVVLVVAVVGTLLWSGPGGQGADRRQQEAKNSAMQVAGAVRAVLDAMVQAADRAGADPALAGVLGAGEPAALRAREAALEAATAGALGARLIGPGVGEPSSDDRMPPITYAALGMMQAAAQGEQPAPEVLLHGQPQAHVAVLRSVAGEGGAVAGYVLIGFDTGRLEEAVAGAGVKAGYVELAQPGSAAGGIASVGRSGLRRGEPAFTLPLTGTTLSVLYWGDAPLASPEEPGLPLLPLAMVVVVLLLAAGGVVVVRRRRTTDKVEAAPAGAPTPAGLSEKLAELKASGVDAGPPPSIEVVEGEAAQNGEPAAAEEPVELPAAIFRAYDVRGVVGDTLTPGIVRLLGLAIGSEAQERDQQTVCVGCDGRASSPELVTALVAGLRESGCDVIDVGRVVTPVLYFATDYLDTGSGVMVTGSHNPPEYNGLKVMLAGDTLFGDDIQALRQRIEESNFSSGSGKLQSMDISADYIRRVSEDVPVALGNAFKVVVDCGNGVAGEFAPKLIRALGHDVVELYCDLDSSFPNHHPDPSQPENLTDLIAAVEENGADLGFAFDGDGDRLGVVDASGRIVWPDVQMMLFAHDVLSRNEGAEIIFDVKCSSRLAKVITKFGGKPVMYKTGHSFIKNKLKESGAPLAGEMSGHIFFKERWYGFDDALYAAARMLEILMGFKRKPLDVFARLPVGVSTPELRVDLDEGEPPALMEALKDTERFADGEVTTIDGLRVDWKDRWGLVRASNTTPSLVLRFEGDDEQALERVKTTFRELLLEKKPGLSLPF
jgi:phosphomannomutase/phosphoglucomutase